MGLLSDPEYGSAAKWFKVLKNHYSPICFLLYIGALVWFVMLANKEFNNETYFSENALLPGLVTNEFNGEQSAKQFFNEFQQELEDKYDDNDEIPVPWLVAKMSQLHLEVYTHNFTLNYPLGDGQKYTGTNVYGILRAPRTSSLEAIVVTAPYRSLRSYQKATGAGIALMLAFAQFARPQKYWAKDIIFLVTEHEQLGMQAWLEAYHGLKRDSGTFYTNLGSFWRPGTPDLDISKLMSGFAWGGDHQKCLDPGKLKGRSGSIQAAINLEIHEPKIKYIEVKIEGLNGQLPNLDLVNLVHKLCVKSGIHHSYRHSYSWIRNRNKMDEWMNGFWTMLSMFSNQISGVPNGNHGLFHHFGIEAVTLEGRDANDPGGPAPKVNALTPANFYRLGVALESILRSLNNLLERFHQSYFFYLLAATNRFISIGQYMPSLCMFCLALTIRGFSIWLSMSPDDDEESDKPKDEQKKKEKESASLASGDNNLEEEGIELETRKSKEEENVLGDQKNKEESVLRKRKSKVEVEQVPGDKERLGTPKKEKARKTKGKIVEDSPVSVFNIVVNYLLMHLIGYAVMNSPLLLSQIGTKHFNTPNEVSVFYGLIAISVFLTVITPYLSRLLCTGPMTFEELSYVNFLLIAQLLGTCLSVAMHNFSLGFAIGIVYVPVALVVNVAVKDEKTSYFKLLLKRLFCLLLHPLSVISIGAIAYSRVLHVDDSLVAMIGRGLDAAMQAVMFSVVDSMIYGNWVFNLAASCILPMWIIFWQISWNTVKAP